MYLFSNLKSRWKAPSLWKTTKLQLPIQMLYRRWWRTERADIKYLSNYNINKIQVNICQTFPMWWHDWLSIIFNILSIRSISKHATSRSHRRPNEKTLYLSLPPQWRGIPSRCKAKYKVHKSSHCAYGETGRDRDEINFKYKKKTFIEIMFLKNIGAGMV